MTASEPFTRLLTQGMVLKDGAKMSKSKGNTVDPVDLIEAYGADTVRLFSISNAPPEHSLEWSDTGVEGASRFLKRLWKAVYTHVNAGIVSAADTQKDSWNDQQKTLRRKIHETIEKVTDDVGRRHNFNTAIAANMTLLNEISSFKETDDETRSIVQEGLQAIVLMLAPIVPHACAKLWAALGQSEGIEIVAWPRVDSEAMVKQEIELVVQVNGKLRDKIGVAPSCSQEEIEKAALASEKVNRFIEDKPVRKVIVVKGRLVNIVI